MDSVVGSLTLAYYYNLSLKESFVPVINCTRDFFPMKLEINMHLQFHKVPELIFMNELTHGELKINEVALIDHNRLDQS